MFCGAVVIAAGYGLAIALMHHTWGIMIGISVVGAGIGLAYAAMPSLIMAAVPATETAQGAHEGRVSEAALPGWSHDGERPGRADDQPVSAELPGGRRHPG